jgi:hypothetical protein
MPLLIRRFYFGICSDNKAHSARREAEKKGLQYSLVLPGTCEPARAGPIIDLGLHY